MEAKRIEMQEKRQIFKDHLFKQLNKGQLMEQSNRIKHEYLNQFMLGCMAYNNGKMIDEENEQDMILTIQYWREEFPKIFDEIREVYCDQ